MAFAASSLSAVAFELRRFRTIPNAAKVALYYGTSDMDKLDALSPVSHVGVHSPPTFVAWSEFENPLIDVHCVELVFRLGQAKRRTPPTFWLRGHNHMSAIAHFNTAEDALGQAILRIHHKSILTTAQRAGFRDSEQTTLPIQVCETLASAAVIAARSARVTDAAEAGLPTS